MTLSCSILKEDDTNAACRSEGKVSVNDPLKQNNFLFARSGNDPAVMMRQTTIEIQYFSGVLICHAPPQHGGCIGGDPISCWHMRIIMRGEKVTAIQTERMGWIPALSG